MKLANALKAIAYKDYFDEQDGKELLVALQELIASLETSEELVTAEQLEEAVRGFFADRLKEGKEVPEVIDNAIRKAVRDIAGDAKVKPSAGYLSSPEAVKDFKASILGSHNGTDFQTAWRGHLTHNGITGLAFPTEVSKGIANSWELANGLFSRMTKVGERGFKLMYTTEDNASTRARGHVKGTEKTQQSFSVQTKDLVLQMIYKWIPIDRIDLAAMADDGAFIDWVVRELSERLEATIERHIISGYPAGETTITSLESIGAKTTTDFWTTIVPTQLNPIEIYTAVALTEGRDKWLYVDKNFLPYLTVADYGNGGGSVFRPLPRVAEEWGLERIIPYDFGLTPGAQPSAGATVAVCLSPESYYRVGGEPFGEHWSIYEKNQEAFMAEIAIGGGLGRPHSSAVCKVAG